MWHSHVYNFCSDGVYVHVVCVLLAKTGHMAEPVGLCKSEGDRAKKTQKRETLILDYALRAWSPGPIVWAECHGRSF